MKPRLNTIIRLARAGALEQAAALFEAGDYLRSEPDDPAVLTVQGRLLKDRAAREEGAARDLLLQRAIAAYQRASDLSRASYPLINAATLAFLAGDAARASALAGQTLALLESGDHAPETPYWLDATRAEAMLLLGRTSEAEPLLAQAIRHQPEAWEDHASTLRQFAMILRQHDPNASTAWLDRFRPPPCLHFEGILGIAPDHAEARNRIEGHIDSLAPAYAVGALAAGADILVAEAVLNRGGYLHVVLPCPIDQFRETSLRPYGAEWEKRFDRLMDDADSVVILDDELPLSDASVSIAREVAMGLAIRENRRIQSSARALRVRAEGEPPSPMGDERWNRLGLPLHEIHVARSIPQSAAMPARGHAATLLAVPRALEAETEAYAGAKRLHRRDDRTLFRIPSLDAGADLAEALAARHSGARIGLDYRVLPDSGPPAECFDTALALSATALNGAIAMSEVAALALTLLRPAANIQPMGAIRASSGDMPVHGLFPDR